MVIGASIAGLCAAKVLAERFEHVLVLDRDELPSTPGNRAAVPQGRHAHVLLEAGQVAFDTLFPGLISEMVAAGENRFDHLAEARIFQIGRPFHRVPAGLHLLTITRPYFGHPAGFVTLGDAFCTFNPVYGKRMTSVVLQTQALADVLGHRAQADSSAVSAYYRAAARAIDVPWSLAAGGDFAFPATQETKAPGTDLINRYVRSVVLSAHTSPRVARAFASVAHLAGPSATLFSPAVVARVLTSRFRRKS